MRQLGALIFAALAIAMLGAFSFAIAAVPVQEKAINPCGIYEGYFADECQYRVSVFKDGEHVVSNWRRITNEGEANPSFIGVFTAEKDGSWRETYAQGAGLSHCQPWTWDAAKLDPLVFKDRLVPASCSWLLKRLLAPPPEREPDFEEASTRNQCCRCLPICDCGPACDCCCGCCVPGVTCEWFADGKTQRQAFTAGALTWHPARYYDGRLAVGDTVKLKSGGPVTPGSPATWSNRP